MFFNFDIEKHEDFFNFDIENHYDSFIFGIEKHDDTWINVIYHNTIVDENVDDD